MTQRKMMELLLERYGAPAQANGNETTALIQPLRSSGGFSGALSALQEDGAFFRYTGPAEIPLEAGQQVASANQSYAVLRAGLFTACGEALYTWAVLRLLAPEERAEILVKNGAAVLARADSCAEKAEQGCRPVAAWGEREAAAVTPGAVGYTLLLYGVRPEPGVDLTALSEFTVSVRQGSALTAYSGCRWKAAEKTGGIMSKPKQTFEVIAAGRTVERTE